MTAAVQSLLAVAMCACLAPMPVAGLDISVVGRRDEAESALKLIYPSDGQVVCDEDQLELLALHDGSPLLPEGSVAVLHVDGRIISELHAGVLSARLPRTSGRHMEVKLALLNHDGSEAASAARRFVLGTADKCPARRPSHQSTRLFWLAVGFDGDEEHAGLIFESLASSVPLPAERLPTAQAREMYICTHGYLRVRSVRACVRACVRDSAAKVCLNGVCAGGARAE